MYGPTDLAALAGLALTAWLALSSVSYIAARLYLYRQGDPEGWRFNEHGANLPLGHLSFYEREGGRAVVLRTFKPFPLFWTVNRTVVPGTYTRLETAKLAPVWRAIPWAFGWMSRDTALADGGEGGDDSADTQRFREYCTEAPDHWFITVTAPPRASLDVDALTGLNPAGSTCPLCGAPAGVELDRGGDYDGGHGTMVVA